MSVVVLCLFLFLTSLPYDLSLVGLICRVNTGILQFYDLLPAVVISQGALAPRLLVVRSESS